MVKNETENNFIPKLNKEEANRYLIDGIYNDSLEKVVIALSNNADPNHYVTSKEYGKIKTALHLAVEKENLNFIRLLLEAGAKPNLENSRKLNVMQSLIVYGKNTKKSQRILELLLESGGNPLLPSSLEISAKRTAMNIDSKKKTKFVNLINDYLNKNPKLKDKFIEDLRVYILDNEKNSKTKHSKDKHSMTKIQDKISDIVTPKSARTKSASTKSKTSKAKTKTTKSKTKTTKSKTKTTKSKTKTSKAKRKVSKKKNKNRRSSKRKQSKRKHKK